MFGVCAFIFEKLACSPCVYTASGTNMEDGVRARFNNYEKRTSLLAGIRRAFEEDFDLTRKGQ